MIRKNLKYVQKVVCEVYTHNCVTQLYTHVCTLSETPECVKVNWNTSLCSYTNFLKNKTQLCVKVNLTTNMCAWK